jgi:hypothetical protein
MRNIAISGHHVAQHRLASAFWIIAGIIAVMVFGDVLTLLAVALAIVTAARWIFLEAEHRLERNDARMAPVIHLRPALSSQRDLKETSAQASWRDTGAA